MVNNARQAYRQALGRVLRKARKAANLSTVDVAKGLGCDRSLVSHLERGRRRLSVQQLDVFAAITHLEVSALMDAVRRELLVGDDGADDRV